MKTIKTIMALLIVSMAIFAVSCKKKNPSPEPEVETETDPGSDSGSGSENQSFTYSNNRLDTGPLFDETPAPEGYNWAAIARPYRVFAAASGNGGFSIADDFTVPSGETWNIEHIYFYALKRVGAGDSDYSINAMYLEIYSGKPSEAGATKVYGDYTTNRFVSSEDYKLYRAEYPTNPNPRSKIHQIKVKTEGLKLTAGTYWFKIQGKTPDEAELLFVSNPYEETNDNNAIAQQPDGDWLDPFRLSLYATSQPDFAFDLEGKK